MVIAESRRDRVICPYCIDARGGVTVWGFALTRRRGIRLHELRERLDFTEMVPERRRREFFRSRLGKFASEETTRELGQGKRHPDRFHPYIVDARHDGTATRKPAQNRV